MEDWAEGEIAAILAAADAAEAQDAARKRGREAERGRTRRAASAQGRPPSGQGTV